MFQQEDRERWVSEVGGYWLGIGTTAPLEPGAVPGGALIVALDDDEYVVAGWNLAMQFSTAPTAVPDVEFLWLETGTFDKGQWVTGRRLNGDETAHGRLVRLGRELTVCRVRLNGTVQPVYHQERF